MKCYLGNFTHSTGFNSSIIIDASPKVAWKLGQVEFPEFLPMPIDPSVNYTLKIYAVLEHVEAMEDCAHYCILLDAKPCEFYGFANGTCFLGNKSDPTNHNLALNMPENITFQAIVNSRKLEINCMF